ncbi:hypothetical protein QQF64_002249 [Cirrhinus molitorella]|uniref:Uncharacterized protein n=1 Tax=Cirrhinus molitorella TaxID=172907 RepID=A0ABR3MPM8_9TELE
MERESRPEGEKMTLEREKSSDFPEKKIYRLSKRALMKEIVHILAHLRGSMWEVSLEAQKTADLGLSAIPAVNCNWCPARGVCRCPESSGIITLSLLPSLCLAVPAYLITPKERWIAWGHTHLPRREGKVDQVITAPAPIMPCGPPRR